MSVWKLGEPGRVSVGDRVAVCNQHGEWQDPDKYFPSTMVSEVADRLAMVCDTPPADSRQYHCFETDVNNLRAVIKNLPHPGPAGRKRR